MNLRDFILLDAELKAKFAISTQELHLLSFITNLWEDEEVTITLLLDKYDYTSPATTHKRLDDLLKTKLVKKRVSNEDSRIKTLEIGDRYSALVKFLKEF